MAYQKYHAATLRFYLLAQSDKHATTFKVSMIKHLSSIETHLTWTFGWPSTCTAVMPFCTMCQWYGCISCFYKHWKAFIHRTFIVCNLYENGSLDGGIPWFQVVMTSILELQNIKSAWRMQVIHLLWCIMAIQNHRNRKLFQYTLLLQVLSLQLMWGFLEPACFYNFRFLGFGFYKPLVCCAFDQRGCTRSSSIDFL